MSDISYQSGFYEEEYDGLRFFRWADKEAIFSVDAGHGRWLLFDACHPGRFPVSLALTFAGKKQKLCLINGWQPVAIDISAHSGPLDIAFNCEADNSVPQDSRRLSLMLSNMRLAEPTPFDRNAAHFHQDLLTSPIANCRPMFLIFETSGACDMDCVMCIADPALRHFAAARPRNARRHWHVYEQLLPFASKLSLQATGEVFAGEDVWRALAEAKNASKHRKLEVFIATNGQRLSEEVIERLVNSPVSDLCVSMDAASEKTYKRIRRGDFQRLLGNVRKLIAKNRERGSIRIDLCMILMRENIEELPDFVQLASDLGANSISYWPLWATGKDMPPKEDEEGFVFYYPQQLLGYYPQLTMRCMARAAEKAAALGLPIGSPQTFSNDYSKFTHKDLPYPLSPEHFKCLAQGQIKEAIASQSVNQHYRSCFFPWQEAYITTDGGFSPCMILEYQGGVDNIIGKDFYTEVWNGKVMQEIRQAVISGKPHKLCKNAQCIFVNHMQ